MDLPVWQGLYQELADDGFTPIAVALDTRGADAARPWIEAAKPGYPCLVDECHTVSALYGMVNVPTAVWIDEDGYIVRPPESAGTNDSFRSMDRTTFQLAPEALASLAGQRQGYLAAIRDWVRRGPESPFVLGPVELTARLRARRPEEAVAAAHARLGQKLWEGGDEAAAARQYREAVALQPESWAYRRQAWNLEHPLKSGGPEFWAAVDALGDEQYYSPPADIPPTSLR